MARTVTAGSDPATNPPFVPPASSPAIPPSPHNLVDEALPLLTQQEAARLRRLVRVAFAERGRECSVAGLWAVDATRTSFGLWSMATACRGAPDDAWLDIIRAHVGAALSVHSGSRTIPASVLTSVKLRLVAVDALPSLENLPHCHAVAPGLVEVLTVDLPQAVITPTSADLSRYGATLQLVASARSNLLDVLDKSLSVATIRTRDGLSFTEVHGRSFHIASLALVMPEVLTCLDPDADARHGVFVAVPNRHQLAFRVVCGLSSLMSLRPLAAFAQSRFEGGVDPISPNVYWVHEGRWEQLTFADGSRVAIHVSRELTAAIDEKP
ncbi:MAG TPA: hypothetical protein VES01_09925 [Dermatophilaceae bacterium]|nr:hypothetical protein [Dermatophilaceae bacterium]